MKTNAKEFKMRVRGLVLFLDVKSVPMEGGANREIITELKKIFKRPVGIVKGHKGKEKVILIKNLMPEDAKKILDQCERA